MKNPEQTVRRLETFDCAYGPLAVQYELLLLSLSHARQLVSID